MTKFDMYVNLRAFPASNRGQQQRDITPEEMAEYFKTHDISHALVLYNRDDYEELEKLGNLTSTKIYGVQCIFGPTKEDPTDINSIPELDVNIEGRGFETGGFSYGVKFASERGWWDKGEVIEAGLNYHKDRIVKKVLNLLPRNSIASFHTQGTSKPDNTASPMMLLNFACKFPDIKFIINHGGDYGPSSTAAKPSRGKIEAREDKGGFLRHIAHRINCLSALEASEFTPNLFIDFSCFTVGKATLVVDGGYTQWAAGSDFPFSENFPINYSLERKNFEKYCEIPDDNAVNFFEKDLKILSKETLDYHDEYYFVKFKEFVKKRKNERS